MFFCSQKYRNPWPVEVDALSLFHYRSHTGQEVDLVLENSEGKLVGIEVKASATIDAKSFKGLKSLAEATKKCFHRGIVLYNGTQILPFGEGMFALPISSLWQPR